MGGGGAGLGLAQMAPIDVQQAEVIKGTATALYGPTALGGVLDLVSRRPTSKPERMVFANQSTTGGTDVGVWAIRQWNEHWGGSLLGAVHRQERVDQDHDGWADVPSHRRFELRPRLFWTGSAGRSLMLTAGTMLEDREGGLAGPLEQRIMTRHADLGAHARLPFGDKDVISVRAAFSGGVKHTRQFDPVLGTPTIRDERATGLAEATWLHSDGAFVTLLGAALSMMR